MKRHHRQRIGARSIVRGSAIGLLVLLLLLLAAWSVAALYIDLPKRWQLPAASICCVILLIGMALLRPWYLKGLLVLSCFAVVMTWWLNIAPSDDRAWQSDVSRTAWADVSDNLVTIHNLRNFSYRTETDYTPNWATKTVDLNNLQGLDIFLTFWGSPWIAHPILSFQFTDGSHVAFSVETRKEIGEEYSAILGFFRQYELIYIVADERDLIRLRTSYRSGEEVYLYHTTASAAEARAVFLDYLRSLNALHDTPAFYNALTSNCTTNIRIHTAAADNGKLPAWDWRLLLNGKSDEYAYQHGRLAGDLPFDELKRRAHINDAANDAGDAADFSTQIRIDRPGF